MKRSKQLLGAVSAAALVAFSASPALAAGTTAGETITNTVYVDFQVGGVNQTTVQGSDSFTVDRKVNVLVTEVGSATTSVGPGQVQAVTTFEVSNLSNDTIDLALSVAQPGSDQFDMTDVEIYLDDGDGVFDAGDTLVTSLDEVAEDATATVFVVANVPIDRVTGDVSVVTLTATAHAGGGAGSLGALLTATAGGNTSGVDTVLADGAGVDDVQYDGKFSANDSYTVLAAAMTAQKRSRIVSDPVNGTSNPKAIPGATVEYCIAVSNASGSATATGVAISDTLPADLTYDGTFGIFLDGTVDGSGNCNTDGSAGGDHTAGVVSGSLSDIAAGVTRTLYFRATIN